MEENDAVMQQIFSDEGSTVASISVSTLIKSFLLWQYQTVKYKLELVTTAPACQFLYNLNKLKSNEVIILMFCCRYCEA